MPRTGSHITHSPNADTDTLPLEIKKEIKKERKKERKKDCNVKKQIDCKMQDQRIGEKS